MTCGFFLVVVHNATLLAGERERERDLVNFETEFHAWPRGDLLVTVHLLLTPTLPALA